MPEQIQPQRVRVGTIVVDTRTGMVRLDDVTNHPDFQDLRILCDVIGALQAAYTRQLTELIIRSHEPIEAVGQALQPILEDTVRPLVQQTVAQAFDEIAEARRKQAGAGPNRIVVPSPVLPAGARPR